MSDLMHRCAINLCSRVISIIEPICIGHREQLQERKGGRKRLDAIDHQYARRQQGIRGAALKYQEAVSAATALLYDSPPEKAKK